MLFNNFKPKKAERQYKVESLNPDRNIFTSMSVSKDRKNYVTCLCIGNRVVKNTFHCEALALEQMKKYKALYKKLDK